MHKSHSSQKYVPQQKILIDLVNCEDNQINFEIPMAGDRRFQNQEFCSATIIIKSCTPNQVTFKVRSNRNALIYSKPFLGVLLEKEKQKKIELFTNLQANLKEGATLKLQIAAMEFDRTAQKYDDQSLKELWQKSEEGNNNAEKYGKNEINYIQKVVILLNCTKTLKKEETVSKNFYSRLPQKTSTIERLPLISQISQKQKQESQNNSFVSQSRSMEPYDNDRNIRQSFLGAFQSQIIAKKQGNSKILMNNNSKIHSDFKQQYEEMILATDEQEKRLLSLGETKAKLSKQLQKIKGQKQDLPKNEVIYLEIFNQIDNFSKQIRLLYGILLIFLSFFTGLFIR